MNVQDKEKNNKPVTIKMKLLNSVTDDSINFVHQMCNVSPTFFTRKKIAKQRSVHAVTNYKNSTLFWHHL